ncbi:MAG: hypothetical protein U0939_05600 [Pirellulales bacterium]
MSTLTSASPSPTSHIDAPPGAPRWAVALLAGGLCALAWGVAWAPLGVSIVAVFLCAGPHNWLEVRYFLGRIPGRLGPLAPFTALGVGGVTALTLTFIAMSLGARYGDWSAERLTLVVALWNTALIGWLLTLALWRQRIPPRRDWPWLVPAALLLLALNWYAPYLVNLSLVFLHPVVALVFLDRELARARSPWLAAYRRALWAVPICLGAMAWLQRDASPLVGQDMISMQIQQHVGADLLPGVSPRLLVTWHAYLELLHYGVWIAAVPAIAVKAAPWQVAQAPLARRSPLMRRLLTAFVLAGGVLVAALWGGFCVDYGATRDLYFTIAIFHVIAEGPMLLRVL